MKKEIDNYHVSLKLLLKNNKNEVLLLKCSPTDGSYAGYFDLVGGRIDKDEFEIKFEKIIEREVLEEVGNIKYKLKNRPVAVGRHKVLPWQTRTNTEMHVVYILFEADFIEGEIKISPEHVGYEWAVLEKIELEKYFTSGILEGIKMYLGK